MSELPRIKAMVEHVVNLGNFESVRFRAEVSLSKKDVSKAFEEAWEIVKEEVREQTRVVKIRRNNLARMQ